MKLNEAILLLFSLSSGSCAFNFQYYSRDWGPGMFPSEDEISVYKWAGEGFFMLKVMANFNFLISVAQSRTPFASIIWQEASSTVPRLRC